jgi:hypothetical protein
MLLTVIIILLLWFGYSLFFGPFSPLSGLFFSLGKKKIEKGEVGDPQVCPICSMRLVRGELVKTVAFPSITGGADRLMYIRGCYSCLNDNLPRQCPVCGTSMSTSDFLVSRMFERPNQKNHVHVVGCNHCKRRGTLLR